MARLVNVGSWNGATRVHNNEVLISGTGLSGMLYDKLGYNEKHYGNEP